MIFEHTFSYDYCIYFIQEQRGKNLNGPQKPYKGYTKSVATLKIVARRDVFKQHFMTMPAAMLYNNRLLL